MTDHDDAGGRPLGAVLDATGCQFTVWAPRAGEVGVHLIDRGEVVPMRQIGGGYHAADVTGVGAGARYRFRLDGRVERPDPASRHQPDGVDGPSAVVDRHWPWTDAGWAGVALDDLVLYELHVGTYTQEGTFDAVVDHLPDLADLGVTAIELMPVNQFPGTRNWGYDGVGLYAPQHSYGGPDGLRRLVDAAHAAGLGVILDVVYNHFGPEGNHLPDFGPYLTDRYRTPWGDAVNVDGPGSDGVRRFFVDNAMMWVRDYHVDGFRLDAVHAIADPSAYPFLEELTAAVTATGIDRNVLVIAEDGHNDPRLSRPVERGGFGMAAQWNDDFHHALHVMSTGESDGYYRDFSGAEDLVTVLRDGYVYGNRYSVHRQHRLGRPPGEADPARHVVFSQNHDQIGNRAGAERLITLAGAAAARAAAALVVLSPGVPLLFMGEEWGDRTPFWYFVDHQDPELVEAVRQGRRAEFAAFGWGDRIPDPAHPETFAGSRPDHTARTSEEGRGMVEWYRALLAVRRHHRLHGAGASAALSGPVLTVRLGTTVLLVVNTGPQPVATPVAMPEHSWSVHLDSGEPRFGGSGRSRLGAGPEVTVSGGEVAVDMPGWAAVVLVGAGPEAAPHPGSAPEHR